MQAVAKDVSRVGFVAGTIPADKVMAFERLLFRATRGNMFLRQGDVGQVRDPVTNEHVAKHVFVIFFSGDRSKAKIMKVMMRGDRAGRVWLGCGRGPRVASHLVWPRATGPRPRPWKAAGCSSRTPPGPPTGPPTMPAVRPRPAANALLCLACPPKPTCRSIPAS